MPFTKEDKILIQNLFELKGYNAKHLVRVSQQRLKCRQHLQVVAKATGYCVGRLLFAQYKMTQQIQLCRLYNQTNYTIK